MGFKLNIKAFYRSSQVTYESGFIHSETKILIPQQMK